MRDPIAAALSHALGTGVADGGALVGGGSIHQAFEYRTERAPVFVKVCALENAARLAAEAAGLRELAGAKAILVPEVLALGKLEDRAFLCLEWLDLVEATPIANTRLGERLAALHRLTAEEFGWHQDNFIGTTPQRNRRHKEWGEFYRVERLAPQLDLAETRGADARTIDDGRKLCESIDAFFASYRPVPSLLHGDLWGGNWGAVGIGKPALFDPAVYYGDREADIAMTRLFGGFSPEFYAAYDATWPLDAGAAVRTQLYNLYHVLNHFNMFGGSYLSQARSMIRALLAELR
jgi:protein-ribulosamine 3-kinase